MVRRKSGGRVHLTPKVPRGGPVTTLCGQTLAAGSYEAGDTASDCANCIRRSADPSRISVAFFEQDEGTELLRLSLEQARFRKPGPKEGVTAPAKRGVQAAPVPRPSRPQVVRSELDQPGCAFCGIATGVVPAVTVYKGPLVVAFMDQLQPRAGHVLVAPIRHTDAIFDLNAPTGAELMAALVRIAAAVRAAFNPGGVSIWSSNGSAAAQEVPHLHFHVLPRWARDGLLRVYAKPPQKSALKALEEQAAAIRRFL